MDFKLDFKVNSPSGLSIEHGDKVALIGSCFSDEMFDHFENSGFHCLSNPFGTLFHPEAIANVILDSIHENEKVNAFHREDIFLSWDSASSIYATNQYDLEERIDSRRKLLSTELKESKLLIITFGTAIGYRHKDLDILVGNCHKAPSSIFNKEYMDIDEMSEAWKELIRELKKINPELNIVFTVSPVRHVKNGLIENNRSKAKLIELVHRLTMVGGLYFPSYEILIDELRDYRFYASDMVHPSEEAVAYVWSRLSEAIFNDDTQALIKKIKNIKRLLNHESLHPESKMDQERIVDAESKKDQLMMDYPQIFWQ